MPQKGGKRQKAKKKGKRPSRSAPRPRPSPRTKVHLSPATRSIIRWFADPWSAPTPIVPSKTLIAPVSYTGKTKFYVPAGFTGFMIFNPAVPFSNYTQGTTLANSSAFIYHSGSAWAGSFMTGDGGTVNVTGEACNSDFTSATINGLTKTWTPIGLVVRARPITTRENEGGTLGAYTIASPALADGLFSSLEGASALGARTYRTWAEWPATNQWRTAYWWNQSLDDAQTVRYGSVAKSDNGLPFGLMATSASAVATTVEVEYRLLGYITGQDARAASRSYPEDYAGYHAICNAYVNNWLGNGSGKISERDVIKHFLEQHSCLL